MKKHAKLITVISLFIALSALLCSCTAPNTVSTDTKYKLTMVGNNQISVVPQDSTPVGQTTAPIQTTTTETTETTTTAQETTTSTQKAE